MTSVNGGTYAGQYPCNGRVDNLQATQYITTTLYFFSDGGTQSEEKH